MDRFYLFLAAALLSVSCSTTRLVPDGKYRLASNKVEVRGEKLSSSEVTPYILQKSNNYFLFGWNPFLNVYNWSDGSGEGINRLWEKVGVEPVVLDPSLVDDSRSNIAGHLRHLGYYDAEVSAEVSTRGKLADVKYVIKPGSRHIIGKVVFDVPEGEFRDDFYADTTNVTVRPGSVLSEAVLEAESVRGASYFRNLGYYDFNKNHYFFEADTLGNEVTLHYRIRGYTRNESEQYDGPVLRYTIGDVALHHPSDIPFKSRLLSRYNTIKPGMTYNEKMVNTTYNRFSALKVFNNVSVEMSPTDSSTVNCDIRLSGAMPMGFKANIEMSTNSSGLIGISPQLTMFHKNIFHGGEWLNLGFTGNWQFMPGSDVSSTELGITSSLSFPQLLGIPVSRIKGSNIPRTEFKASYNYQNRPEYRRSLASLSYGFTGQFSSNWAYQVYPVQVNLSKLFSLSDDFLVRLVQNPLLLDSFTDHVDAGLAGTVFYRSDPDIAPKTSYSFANMNFDIAGNALSLFNKFMPVDGISGDHLLLGVPYSQYVKGEVSLGHVFRYGREDGQALAFRMVAGFGTAYGNSSSIPWEKMLYCGGASSMRGWQARTLGPGFDDWNDIFIIPSQVGDLKFEADMEYRFKMFWKLEGAMFAEVGNIWMQQNLEKDFIKSMAADWGLGLRVNLDFILLRVDTGFKIHEPSREAGHRWVGPSGWFRRDGFAVHFGVGYPF